MGVIYFIANKSNKKIYVGQSSNFKKRWENHKFLLNKNAHFNPHLQSSWNKYGKDFFKFGILECCSDEEMDDKEDLWISYFDSRNQDKGYNLKGGGSNGFSRNKETCEKISKSLKGRKLSESHKQHLSESHKGTSSRLGTSIIEEWGGLWFLKNMASTNISLKYLSECIGVNKETIRTYLRNRDCVWSELTNGGE